MSSEAIELKDDFERLLQSLRETSNSISEIIQGLADAELRWRNSYDQFSVLENICHLRDIEVEGYTVRIRRILEEPNPFLPDINGMRLAAERRYNSLNAETALHSFTAARAENVERLQSVSADQLKREGTLEGVGKICLGRLAAMMREHDESHLEELQVLRRQLKRNS